MGIRLRARPSSLGSGAKTSNVEEPVISDTAWKMRLLISPLAVGIRASFLKGIARSFSPSKLLHLSMVSGATNSYVDSGKASWMATVIPLEYLSSGSCGRGCLDLLWGLRFVASRIWSGWGRALSAGIISAVFFGVSWLVDPV